MRPKERIPDTVVADRRLQETIDCVLEEPANG